MTPEAPITIREAAEKNPIIYSVLNSTPDFLLGGLNAETRVNVVYEGAKRIVPDAIASLEYASKLNDMAADYDQHIRSVNASFYNDAVADKASLRVEV